MGIWRSGPTASASTWAARPATWCGGSPATGRRRYDTFDVPGAVLDGAARVVDVISVQPNDRRFDPAKFDGWHRRTGKPTLISDWNLSHPTAAHPRTMWPQLPDPAASAAAYEAFLSAAFDTPYVLGYCKCQYADQVLPTGVLKPGLVAADDALHADFADRLTAIHRRLADRLTAQGRLDPRAGGRTE
jgi:hypothetical protein